MRDDSIGNTGIAGNTGNTGNTGNAGSAGNTESAGNAGSTGNVGDAGSTGNIENREKRTDTCPVDIVIPVYNGFEDLKACVESVKRHTDLQKHRVILIDDCSTDDRVAPYLDMLAGNVQTKPGAQEAAGSWEILHNAENKGFSANVNTGLTRSSDRDVLLLNADTVVTAGWVDKLQACAHASSRTATATPLSNSATLCSVPVMCQDNALPEQMTIDRYAALIERCSFRRYPRVTVAVGFCMYIRREAIREVGLFDEKTFQRGYGEENDFCNRAEQLGYQHVMCDDTFIYHSGTASFQPEEKQQLIEAHDRILRERYPEQMENNHLYCMENPDQYIRDNIQFYTDLYTGKKNILYVLQADFLEGTFNSVGGTQLHVRDLMQGLRENYNIFVAARDEDMLLVTSYVRQEPMTLRFPIGEPELFEAYHRDDLQKLFRELLLGFQIDLVHVHHTQGLSLDIFTEAKRLEIPVIITLHDYYYACPTIKLFDYTGQFCPKYGTIKQDAGSDERCTACLREECGLYTGMTFLKKWRAQHEKALLSCEKIIFPSESARDIMVSCYPSIAEHAVVIAHGCDLMEDVSRLSEITDPVQITERARICLDRVLENVIGNNDIVGWAYLDGVDNEDTVIHLEIFDSAGRRECYRVKKEERPDVAVVVQNPLALHSGIYMRLFSETLMAGPCRIRVILEKSGLYYSDNKYYRGVYEKTVGLENSLNVAFLGGMVPAKGSALAREMIIRDKERINWFVFGTIGEDQFEDMHQDNFFMSGTYMKWHIKRMLQFNHIDVICIFSLWAETFCYTLSEAWLCGIPVIAMDVGAVGERVRKTGAGWLVSPDSRAEDLVALLHHLQEHPEEIEEKKEIIRSLKLKSVAEMCADYDSFYAGLLENSGERQLPKPDARFLYQGIQRRMQLKTEKLESDVQNSLNGLLLENEELKRRMGIIEGTISYRAARKISAIPVPFKHQVRKLLKKEP